MYYYDNGQRSYKIPYQASRLNDTA